MKWLNPIAVMAVLLAGCWRSSALDGTAAPDAATDTDTDADTDTDTDTDTDVDGDSDSDSDTDTDTGTDTDTPAFVLPDTNQSQCTAFDSEWYWVDCDEIAEGEWLYGQDGHYQSPARQHDYTFGDDGTVVDEVSGLTWQRCTAGLESDDCSSGTVLTGPWEGGVYYCDTLDIGGYDDWRLPSVHELHTLYDIDISTGPSIDPVVFPLTPADEWFWSTDEYVAFFVCPGICYWTVRYETEGTGPGVEFADMAVDWTARCVRGEQTEMGQHASSVVDGDRVVSDLATGLEWQGCVAELGGGSCQTGWSVGYQWEDALSYCETLEWAGHDDWRLPDRLELASIVDYPGTAPFVFPEMEVSGLVGLTWTSTTIAADAERAAAILFDLGDQGGSIKNASGRVICVRGGP